MSFLLDLKFLMDIFTTVLPLLFYYIAKFTAREYHIPSHLQGEWQITDIPHSQKISQDCVPLKNRLTWRNATGLARTKAR
jgi:hypothetical protein